MDDVGLVYAIAEPRGGIRYVGATSNLERRIQTHISGGTPVGEWMKENPHEAIVLERCEKNLSLRERFWIVQCMAAGHALFNANKFSSSFAPKLSRKRMAVAPPEIEAIIVRATVLRITEAELCQIASVTPSRYWRARTGVAGVRGRLTVVRQLEQTLDQLEARAKG